MFVGHYGVSFAAKKAEPAIPLWVLFIAGQRLDVLVHRTDLPLYDNTAKVGLGLWNLPAVAFGLEAVLLFGGMWLSVRLGTARRTAMLVFGVVMLGIQAYVFFC